MWLIYDLIKPFNFLLYHRSKKLKYLELNFQKNIINK